MITFHSLNSYYHLSKSLLSDRISLIVHLGENDLDDGVIDGVRDNVNSNGFKSHDLGC